MSSTLPTYEMPFIRMNHPVSGATLNNVYTGHFSRSGARDGRYISQAPIAPPVMDRFKSYNQLAYSLPPTMKELR
jgi:hypothetical protein